MRCAFMCAMLSMLTIGLTPGAVGNADASQTHRLRASHV